MTSPEQLAELLTLKRPDVATRKALVVVDLQNDFAAQGKLPLAWGPGFSKLANAVAAVRANGLVVWVRSEYKDVLPFDADHSTAGGDPIIQGPSKSVAPAADEDEDSEDEFMRGLASNSSLSASASALMKRVAARAAAQDTPVPRDLYMSHAGAKISQQCCVSGTTGALWIPELDDLMDERKDLSLVKTTYSAFSSTNLLHLLRSRLVTELYVCGSLTNVSVYATAASAVSHGMQITLIEDCLGHLDAEAHEEAVAQMSYYMGASIVSVSDFPPAPPHSLQKRPSQLLQPTSPTATPRLDTSIPPSPLARSPIHADRYPPTLAASRIPRRASSGNFSRIPRSASRASSGRDSPLPTPRQVSRTKAMSPASASSDELAHDAAGVRPMLDEAVGSDAAGRETEDQSGDTGALEQTVDDGIPAAVSERLKHLQIAPTVTEPPTPDALFEEPLHVDRPTAPMIHVSTLDRTHRGQQMGDGDSELVVGSLDGLVEGDAFSQLKHEVRWQKMYHASGEVPRLVCAQGTIDEDGSMPVYRHPADHSLPLMHFSPRVDAIRKRAERVVGHPLNHALVQLYRGGQDYISEHSDKTLDIVRGSFVVNASIGAQRTLRLRTKRPASRQREAEGGEGAAREQQLVPLPHGSLFLLGPQDNMRYLHSIRANKRPEHEKAEAETMFGGERISLTFRLVGTFLSADSTLIWGQGATEKTRARARPTVNGNAGETRKMIDAFGMENQSTMFHWEDVYGQGFDVLHLHHPAQQESCMLFLSDDHEANLAVRILLEERAVPYMLAGVSPNDAGADFTPSISFRDTDAGKTQVDGLEAILIYLDRFYGATPSSRVANVDALRLVLDLSRLRRSRLPRRFLDMVEQQLRDRAYLSGDEFGIADCAYWPVIEESMEEYHDLAEFYPRVDSYHDRVSARSAVARLLWTEAQEAPRSS